MFLSGAAAGSGSTQLQHRRSRSGLGRSLPLPWHVSMKPLATISSSTTCNASQSMARPCQHSSPLPCSPSPLLSSPAATTANTCSKLNIIRLGKCSTAYARKPVKAASHRDGPATGGATTTIHNSIWDEGLPSEPSAARAAMAVDWARASKVSSMDSTDAQATSTSSSVADSQTQQQTSTATTATAATVAADIEAGLGWRRRWTMVLLCFTAFMLCNMDRVNMAVAILPMSQQYSWQPATIGLVQSSFFWGYLLTQVLGGVWANKFGGKVVLGLGVAWWSFATAITPFAAQAGLPTLMAARALMGLGEGVAMPAMNQLLSRWVPTQERSRSLSLVYSGMFLGSMTGLTLSPQIIAAFGWPTLFVSFGSLGAVWLAAWMSQAAATPAKDPRISPKEREFITANTLGGAPIDVHGGAHSSHAAPAATSSADESTPIPWKALLSRPEVWAILGAHFCHNWGTFILLTWMPSYYNQVLGLDLASSATLSCLPWATMAVFANLGGWLADTAISKGASITLVRKVMQSIGFLGPAFFLTQLNNVDSVMGAVICMMGAQGCDAFSQSGLYSNHQDIAPRYAGVLLGMSNTAGVLAGVLGSLVTGWILQHGTWSQVWQVAIVFYLIGTVIWNVFSTGKRIFD